VILRCARGLSIAIAIELINDGDGRDPFPEV
jgi:hypothetical protein